MWIGLTNSKGRINRLKGQMDLDYSLAKVISVDQYQRSNKKRKLMAALIDLDPKYTHKLRSKGGNYNKLYVTKLKTIYFWFFYREVNGRRSTTVNFSDLIKNNPEELESTK